MRLLAVELETLVRALEAAREGATHEEAKPENDKDTRALEQSYLAHGQAKRVEELRLGIAEVHAMSVRSFDADAPVALGALVSSEEGGEMKTLFIAPHGGGTVLAAKTVQVVTPRSPLGRALIGKRAGDDCEVALAGRMRELQVTRVE